MVTEVSVKPPTILSETFTLSPGTVMLSTSVISAILRSLMNCSVRPFSRPVARWMTSGKSPPCIEGPMTSSRFLSQIRLTFTPVSAVKASQTSCHMPG